MTANAESTMRPLSDLDGPLSHLLAARNAAEIAWQRAKLNVERFLAAVDVITEEAAGRYVDRRNLPDAVRAWLTKIEFRSASKAVRFISHIVQRAD